MFIVSENEKGVVIANGPCFIRNFKFELSEKAKVRLVRIAK